jgi:phage shock protein PspC (stress-responsive transcriptional regulator)
MVGGVFIAIEGVGVAAGGTILGFGVSGVVAIPVGMGIAIAGVDQAIAGFRTMIDGEHHTGFIGQGINGVFGGGGEYYDIGVNLVAGGVGVYRIYQNWPQIVAWFRGRVGSPQPPSPRPSPAPELPPSVAPQGKTWQDFLPEAQRRLDATKAKYGNVEAQMMAMSRKDALKRLNGLSPRVEEHLQKIANNPGSRDIPHWKGEAENWIRQMENVLPHVGEKTAAEWAARIAEWRARLGG